MGKLIKRPFAEFVRRTVVCVSISMPKARSRLFGQIVNIQSVRVMYVRKRHVFLRLQTIPNVSCTHRCVDQMGRINRFPGKRRWITSKIGFAPFWHPDLESERARLARYATEQSHVQTEAATFTLLSRRRRLGQNSWIHGATHDGKTEASAWLCLVDMERLSLQVGDEILVSSAAGSIRLPALSHEGILPGMVVVPHGLPEVNVNNLIGSDQSLIEPLSGMHRMTGNQVQVKRANTR